MLTLGANLLVTALATLFVLTCLFMMLVILIQKPKGGGLSGAFGGAGGSSQALTGAKTGDVLTIITIICFVLFLALSMSLVYAIRAEVTPKSASTTPASNTPAQTTTTPTQSPATTESETTQTEPTETPAQLPADVPDEPDAQP